MLADYLSEEQVEQARRLRDEGKTFGEIADALGEDSRGQQVTAYHLSPWLYAEVMGSIDLS